MSEFFYEKNSVLLTEFLTLNTGESPNVVVECSLSQILTENVPEKYYLSQKACAGILRRVSERKKILPPKLKTAIENFSEEVDDLDTRIEEEFFQQAEIINHQAEQISECAAAVEGSEMTIEGKIVNIADKNGKLHYYSYTWNGSSEFNFDTSLLPISKKTAFYYKKEIEVENSDGEKIFGTVYIMHEERELGQPTEFYFHVLRDAYEKFNFDLKILEDALKFSKK